jgi:hypothetical protein
MFSMIFKDTFLIYLGRAKEPNWKRERIAGHHPVKLGKKWYAKQYIFKASTCNCKYVQDKHTTRKHYADEKRGFKDTGELANIFIQETTQRTCEVHSEMACMQMHEFFIYLYCHDFRKINGRIKIFEKCTSGVVPHSRGARR